MKPHFEVLDHHPTPMGDLILRRRRPPGTDSDWIYEILLGGDFLMSSQVRTSEEQLAEIPLAFHPGESLDVLVAGLGLGYTAAATLQNPRVRTLTIVERLLPVITWHQDNRLPLGKKLTEDPRCRIEAADFFEWIGDTSTQHDLILVDIDHSPDSLLANEHAAFYEPESIQSLLSRLLPAGVFGLWSSTPPTSAYLELLETYFEEVQTHTVEFHNPHIGDEDSNTIILARKA